MKNKLAVLIILLIGFLNVKSQDTITLNNGLTIYGLITDIGDGQIKFRIDGGAVEMANVKTYTKSGQQVSVNNQISSNTNNSTSSTEECEIKNVGDIQFENKMPQLDAKVYIYAIGIQPEGDFLKPTNNPLVAVISVPANGTATAYDLTAGVHYIYFEIANYGINPGQIRIKKCQTSKQPLKITFN